MAAPVKQKKKIVRYLGINGQEYTMINRPDGKKSLEPIPSWAEIEYARSQLFPDMEPFDPYQIDEGVIYKEIPAYVYEKAGKQQQKLKQST